MRIRIIIIILLFLGLNSLKSNAQTKTVYMVSDAHLDTQWDWDVQTTIDQYLKNTLVDNFALFEKYPNYKFNFEGAIKYMWFKEYYPELYSQLKKYVATGQWNITGSSLDATDIIVPSTESQIRNILIGQTFYKREFGVKSNDIFLPDCFGFGYTLPTIMNHCGLIGFCTQKLSWGGITTPFKIGAWQGVDGSKIIAAADAGNYTARFDEDLSRKSELIDWVNETGKRTNDKHFISYRLYGTGDRGGAPDDNTVNWIEKSIKSDGPLTVKSATASDMYNDYFANLDDFPLYNGELIMTTHGTGCYTSRTMLKRWNRKNELLADAAERSAVMADWMGGLNYPAEDLNNAWIKLIWHQFHDDLTGTSIPRAYTFSYNDEVICQHTFASVLKNSVGAGVRSLNTQAVGTPVVVYNPLSIDRNDVVEVNLKTSAKTEFIKVVNKEGLELPAQVILSNDTLVKFIFNASVKALGYEVYDVRPSATAPAGSDNLKITSASLENTVYKIMINANGDISSIVDKQNGNRQLLLGSIRLALFNNISTAWPSWEIMYSTLTKSPRAFVDGTPEISIVEQGPVRITLKISRTKENSTYDQYIRLTNSDTKARIDVENDINWKTTNTLLKAVFPMAVSNPEATYDLGIGVIKRPNNTSNRYEVPAQQWADITNSDDSYGISILNDCKYGWDKPTNNMLRLSLIHTPQVDRNYVYQANQDLGTNKFTYSIYGHAKNALEAGSTWEAAKLNQPLIAFVAPKHDGNLGKSFSMVKVESPQMALKTFKKAENSDDYILRFYETLGKPATNIKVKFASKIISASEVNGIEEVIGGATFSDSTLTISANAFQPKSFSVKLAAPAVALTTPESKSLSIPFNADVVTTQANMKDGDFDGKSNSYAAELLPDTIVYEGISFEMGSGGNGKKNALRCAGNVISIPSGYKKLYILAASSKPEGSADNFYIGDKAFNLNIQYFSDFIGQASAYNFIAGDTVISPDYFKQESVAWTGTHLHNGNTNSNKSYVFTYLFKYCIVLPEGATELKLPDNNNIAVFAITAANNENDDTTPAAELFEIQKSEEFQTKVPTYCGENLSESKLASASGQTGAPERAEMAIDGDESTKWCQNISSDKWLVIDLGSNRKICEWRVKHAAMESIDYVTKDFKLQRLQGTQWIDVDEVKGNTLNTTDRKVTPFIARKVRLYITDPGNDNAARIYEFQVFGDTQITGMNNLKSAGSPSVNVFPNPVTSKNLNVQLNGFDDDNHVAVTLTNINGKKIFYSENLSTSDLNFAFNNAVSNGLYFIHVKGKKSEANGKFIVSI